MGEDLNKWVTQKMSERGWNKSQLARMAGLDPSYISNILAGKRQPGAKFYLGMAKAFDVTVDQIERLDVLGIDPENFEDWDDPISLKELINIFEQLDGGGRVDLLKYAIYLWREDKAQKRKREEGDD